MRFDAIQLCWIASLFHPFPTIFFVIVPHVLITCGRRNFHSSSTTYTILHVSCIIKLHVYSILQHFTHYITVQLITPLSTIFSYVCLLSTRSPLILSMVWTAYIASECLRVFSEGSLVFVQTFRLFKVPARMNKRAI